MAQTIVTRFEYLGTIQVKSGEEYLASDFATAFPDATAFMMKTKGKIVNGKREQIQVSIDNTPLFPIEYGEVTAFDSTRTPALKYKFSQDCIVLAGKDLDVTP